MTEKRFTTVELPKPNRWGIWYNGACLSTYQVCILLNEYVDVKKENEQLKQQLEDLSFEFKTQNKHHYDCRCSQSYADGTMICSIHDEIDPESKVCKDFKGYW